LILINLGDTTESFGLEIIVSTSLLVVGILTLFYSIIYNRAQRKVLITMSLYEKWSSKEFSLSRTNARECFDDALRQFRQKKRKEALPIAEIYKRDKEKDFGSIEHFFDDLGRLSKAKQIDKKLSRTLFEDVFNQWNNEVFSVIDYSRKPNWGDTSIIENLKKTKDFWKF
jgi:hypothetical protein